MVKIIGLSALILVDQNSNIPIENIIENINIISKKINYYFGYSSERYDNAGNLQYVYAAISDMPFIESLDRQVPFGIFDEKSYDYCNYISLNFNTEIYFRLIIIEEYCNNEDILLKFSYEILKIYKDAKLYTEFDWFYTLDDLEKIIHTSYNDNWCYKKGDCYS